jgi:signal transduction histidine kinase/DNA-binding response OmpR family regulator
MSTQKDVYRALQPGKTAPVYWHFQIIAKTAPFDERSFIPIPRAETRLICISNTLSANYILQVVRHLHLANYLCWLLSVFRRNRHLSYCKKHLLTDQQANQLIQKQCERFLATCPVALCLARLSDGTMLKLNERFLIMTDSHEMDTGDLESLRLKIWTEADGETDLKKRLRDIQTLRNIDALFSIQDGGPQFKARAGISLINLGDDECMLVFLEEHNETKKVEQALSTARDAALESARLKSEFLANISHEIRTPLNGVIGMTTLLLDTKLGSLQRNFTETIRISADNLLNLINEILDFSKLEAGKLVVESAPFDLLSTLETTLDLLAERAQSKGLELTYFVSPEVPRHLVGDAGRIRQILTNLIGNAIKFTAEGEVSLEVNLDHNPEIIRFEIRDTGVGIPPESLHELFQAFHQVDSSSSRRYEGTGLGLAISRQLVEVMGGAIGVESKPSAGSIFWFSVPAHQQTPPPAPSPVPEKLLRASILVVEKNISTAQNLTKLLEHCHITSKHVTTGEQAVEALKQGTKMGQPYDVAIIDMDTPDINGLSLSRKIKSTPAIASTSILILTTVTHQVETNMLNASNIGACLTKPLKQSRLLDYLAGAMSEQQDVKPPAARMPDIESTHISGPESPEAANLSVLIAEDNGINQKVAKGLLTRLGFHAEVVADGKTLLRALEMTPRDLVFMDCHLPEMDGFQATTELRLREKRTESLHRTYVIAMTADVIPGARERCITAGMDDYLSKPIRLEELQAVLRRATEFVNVSRQNGETQHPIGFLDPAVMDTLRLLNLPGAQNPLPQLIDEFVEAAQHRLEQLQSAMIERDVATIETAAHSLRGSAAGIGALRLADLSAAMEDGVRNGSFNQTAAILSQMDEEFLLVKSSLDFEKKR